MYIPISPRRAVYAGSFDPPTNGHLWMIAEAQQLFDELIVAIGVNAEKRNTYTVSERRQMLEQVTAPFTNVRIDSFEVEKNRAELTVSANPPATAQKSAKPVTQPVKK